jgi:hypothetical protein
VNGSTKKAIAIAPARSSQVHRKDVEMRVTSAANGKARKSGGAGGRSPRAMRYVSARTAEAITR